MARGALGTRFRRDRFFQLGLLLVGGVVLAALLAPWLAPFDPLTGALRNAYLLEPGVRYLLGTDTQGRDVLSRVLYGAVTLGVALGLLAGFVPGLAISVAVHGFNLVGDALREVYDPKLGREP